MAIIDRAYAFEDCNSEWEPTWIVEPFLMRDGVTIIHAEPKARKSTFRAHLIAAHWEITKKVWNTLVVIGEENRHAEATRIGNAFRALGVDPAWELAQIHPLEEDGIKPNRVRIVPPISGVWLDDEAYIEAVCEEIALYDIDLVILDPLTGFHKGVENDADAMARVCAGIRKLSQGTSVLVIHHDSKLDPQSKRKSGDRMRGSSVLRGAYDLGIEIRDAGPDCRELHFEARYSPPIEPQLVRVQYHNNATHWSYLGEKDLAMELRDYLKAQGGSWVTENRLQMELPHPISKVKYALETMVLQGECVHLNGDGKAPRWKLVAPKAH
jgi:hypothetical protein